ncbi:MAG: hypothetical protein R6X02_01680 [Enhygromyxa sp.]
MSEDETSDGNGDGDDDGATTTGADMPTTGGKDDACGCEAGQLCVGDCVFPIGFDPTKIINSRCIDAGACDEHGIDSPECMELACARPWAETLDECGPAGATNGYDIVCSEKNPAWCDEITQDCPQGEKCVIRPADRWGHHTARCVPVTGTDAAGEPCTSAGASPDSDGTDSCDATSMCWSGSLDTEPFEGTCHGFCSDYADSSACPEQTSCQLLEDSFWLCVP